MRESHEQFTAWKVSKYEVFSGPHFSVFSPNTGKYGPEKTPYWDTFHAVILLWNFALLLHFVFENRFYPLFASRTVSLKKREKKKQIFCLPFFKVLLMNWLPIRKLFKELWRVFQFILCHVKILFCWNSISDVSPFDTLSFLVEVIVTILRLALYF